MDKDLKVGEAGYQVRFFSSLIPLHFFSTFLYQTI